MKAYISITYLSTMTKLPDIGKTKEEYEDYLREYVINHIEEFLIEPNDVVVDVLED